MNDREIKWFKTHAGLREAAVVILLRRHAGKDGWCRKSMPWLAASLPTSPSTIRNALVVLRDLGVVEEHREIKWAIRPSARRVLPFTKWRGSKGRAFVDVRSRSITEVTTMHR